MKPLFVSFLALMLFSASLTLALAKDKKEPEQDPVIWGLASQNAGCVIFRESHKTSGHFYGVAIATKTYGQLDVIETQNYDMAQKNWLETQDNVNELQRLAVKDRLKFVKIQENYSPALLEKARAACTTPTLAP